MRDPHSKEPRGFAFVTMDTAEEADAAIAGLNATEMGGKIISIERDRRGRARTRLWPWFCSLFSVLISSCTNSHSWRLSRPT